MTQTIERGEVEYLTCAETAKLVRAALKASFPGVKFSVRSDTYSGGASIHVSWVDGPTQAEVSAVTDRYQGGGFDGMIDLAYNVYHYRAPDGSIGFYRSPGTQGSGGVHPAVENEVPEGSTIVSLGADHVFASRSLSPEFRAEIEALISRVGEPYTESGHYRFAFGGRVIDGQGPQAVWQVSTSWSKFRETVQALEIVT